MTEEEFKVTVLTRLSSIDSRLSAIEEKLEDATNFASGLVDDGALLGPDLMATVKTALDRLSPSDSVVLTPTEDGVKPSQELDLSRTLMEFRERLSQIKEVISAVEDG